MTIWLIGFGLEVKVRGSVFKVRIRLALRLGLGHMSAMIVYGGAGVRGGANVRHNSEAKSQGET